MGVSGRPERSPRRATATPYAAAPVRWRAVCVGRTDLLLWMAGGRRGGWRLAAGGVGCQEGCRVSIHSTEGLRLGGIRVCRDLAPPLSAPRMHTMLSVEASLTE